MVVETVVVIPWKLLLYPKSPYLKNSERWVILDFGKGGKVRYENPLRPFDIEVYYCLCYFLKNEKEIVVRIREIAELLGIDYKKNMSRIADSLTRLQKATIHFLGKTLEKKPDHKMSFFHIKKERKGNQRLYIVSHTKEYMELFELGYAELNLNEYLKLRGGSYKSGKAKRFYELWLFRNQDERRKNSTKNLKEAKEWDFDKTGQWMRLKDSNTNRKTKSLKDLHEHFCDLNFYKNDKPKQTKTKKPQRQYQQWQQKQPMKNTNQAEINQEHTKKDLAEFYEGVAWLEEEFSRTSIGLNISSVKKLLKETSIKDLLERLSEFKKEIWPNIKHAESYRNKARFGNFAGTVVHYLKTGEDHFKRQKELGAGRVKANIKNSEQKKAEEREIEAQKQAEIDHFVEYWNTVDSTKKQVMMEELESKAPKTSKLFYADYLDVFLEKCDVKFGDAVKKSMSLLGMLREELMNSDKVAVCS